jgi:chromosome segregation ATPase
VARPEDSAVPEGRKRPRTIGGDFCRPFGTQGLSPFPPSVKTLGYSQKSLRDSVSLNFRKAYKEQQVKEQAERAQKEKIRQDQVARELKATLQRQQQTTKDRIEAMEKEVAQLRKEIRIMDAKAAGTRRNSAAHVELRAARGRLQDLVHRLGEQKDFLDKVNKQLDFKP